MTREELKGYRERYKAKVMELNTAYHSLERQFIEAMGYKVGDKYTYAKKVKKNDVDLVGVIGSVEVDYMAGGEPKVRLGLNDGEGKYVKTVYV